jgi:hypothetical protein
VLKTSFFKSSSFSALISTMVATAFATEHAPVLATINSTSPKRVAHNVPLPMEAVVLKESIRKTHSKKCFAFSLLHMRKVAVPPVRIPDIYRTSRLPSLRVGGREVPYTRLMWERTKRNVFAKGKLHTIRENGGIVTPSRY